MGEALYEAYRVPKARQNFGSSLRRTPQTNSSPTCTGARLPKAALHARRLVKAWKAWASPGTRRTSSQSAASISDVRLAACHRGIQPPYARAQCHPLFAQSAGVHPSSTSARTCALCIRAPKSWVGRAAAPKICRSSWHAAGLEPGLAHASHGLPSPPACTPAPCRSAPVNMKEMTRSTVAESIPLSHQHESTPPTQRTP